MHSFIHTDMSVIEPPKTMLLSSVVQYVETYRS